MPFWKNLLLSETLLLILFVYMILSTYKRSRGDPEHPEKKKKPKPPALSENRWLRLPAALRRKEAQARFAARTFMPSAYS